MSHTYRHKQMTKIWNTSIQNRLKLKYSRLPPPDDELEGDEPQLCSSVDDQNTNPESVEAEILPPPDDELQYSEDEEPQLCSSHGASLQLYDGPPLTVSSSSVLIMKYKMRHNLSQEALADLLQLHCPPQNHCLPSVYHFKKQFPDMLYPIIMHYFCSECLHAVECITQSVCSNPHCTSELSASYSVSYFIEVPLESQLEVLFEHKYEVPLYALLALFNTWNSLQMPMYACIWIQ